MKYTITQIQKFQNTVCHKCNNICTIEPQSCPKLFNFVLYDAEDGKCPETKDFLTNLKK